MRASIYRQSKVTVFKLYITGHSSAPKPTGKVCRKTPKRNQWSQYNRYAVLQFLTRHQSRSWYVTGMATYSASERTDDFLKQFPQKGRWQDKSDTVAARNWRWADLLAHFSILQAQSSSGCWDCAWGHRSRKFQMAVPTGYWRVLQSGCGKPAWARSTCHTHPAVWGGLIVAHKATDPIYICPWLLQDRAFGPCPWLNKVEGWWGQTARLSQWSWTCDWAPHPPTQSTGSFQGWPFLRFYLQSTLSPGCGLWHQKAQTNQWRGDRNP